MIDVESFIQATISVLYTLGGDFDKVNTVSAMIAKITSSDSHGRLRLKSLVGLLNLIMEPISKYNILISILKYSQQIKLTKLIFHFHNRIDDWIIEWKLNDLQKRVIYQLISEILSIENLNTISLNYLIKYFDTYTGEKYPTEVETIAITAVLSAIKSPVSSFSDRSTLLDVSSHTDPNYSTL